MNGAECWIHPLVVEIFWTKAASVAKRPINVQYICNNLHPVIHLSHVSLEYSVVHDAQSIALPTPCIHSTALYNQSYRLHAQHSNLLYSSLLTPHWEDDEHDLSLLFVLRLRAAAADENPAGFTSK